MPGGGAGSMLDMINRLKQNNQYFRSLREKRETWHKLASSHKERDHVAGNLNRKMTPSERRLLRKQIADIRRRERLIATVLIIWGLIIAGGLILLFFIVKW
jgi:hypothetical protein